MISFTHLTSAQDNERHATREHNELMLHILTTMTERITQLEQQVNEFGQWRNNADHTAVRLNELEAGLGKLTDLTAGGLLDPFDERVLEVLDVRSGSAREALGLEDADVERWILATIEENSGEAFGHIEAEIEEKIGALLEGHEFAEAVTDAVQGSLHGIVEEILDGILPDAITDTLGDPEDIVRKGLRSIL